MRYDCEGCIEDFEEALRMKKKGFFIASVTDIPHSFLDHKGHFYLVMVDNKGKVVVM